MVNLQQDEYIAALASLNLLGPQRLARVLEYFPSPQHAWEAGAEALAAAAGIRETAKLKEEKEQIFPERLEQKLINHGIRVIMAEDEAYPPLLRQIDSAPPVLFLQGKLPDLAAPAAAIVGTRNCTAYGREVAARLAEDLAARGVTIISGMARGIDTWAHKGCLRAGGKTIAVLGCGLDICYPPENRELKEDIIASGAVISEFPPGTPPNKQNFPRRNRIISGLSLATVIVEAPSRSGALITADFALAQGREVMALPGSIFSPCTIGTHRLIQEGAALVHDAGDILEVLGLNQPVENPPQTALTLAEAAIYNLLEYEPESIDAIARKAGRQVQEIMPLLTKMALKGIISTDGGNKYFRAS